MFINDESTVFTDEENVIEHYILPGDQTVGSYSVHSEVSVVLYENTPEIIFHSTENISFDILNENEE